MADRFEYYFCSCCEAKKYSLSNPDKVGHYMGQVNTSDPTAESHFIIAYSIKDSNITNPRENMSWRCFCIKIKGAFPRNETVFRRGVGKNKYSCFS